MLIVVLIFAVLLGFGLWLFWNTRIKAAEINRRFPPIGQFIVVNGMKVHYLDLAANQDDAPTIVFLHGASGNLRDAETVFRNAMEGKARLIFLDRPGHGWSERNNSDLATVSGQAEHIMTFLDEVGVENFSVFGHSWGAALALTMAVKYPSRIQGMVLNAPVSHPWPGGINWYYDIAPIPVLGPLLANLLALPLGLKQLDCATAKVFWPDPVPERYRDDVGVELVLRPKPFRANSWDIALLRDHLVEISPRYPSIQAPVVIINGERDQVVLPWVHSESLARDIPNARMEVLKNSGHMPHHANADLVVKALFEVSGQAKSFATAAE